MTNGAPCKTKCDAELERRRKERDTKRDARRVERGFIQRCLVSGALLSEEEEVWWATLKAARDIKINQRNDQYLETYRNDRDERHRLQQLKFNGEQLDQAEDDKV